jgi:hypothetical protein
LWESLKKWLMITIQVDSAYEVDMRNDNIQKLTLEVTAEKSKASEYQMKLYEVERKLEELNAKVVELTLSVQLSETAKMEYESKFNELQAVSF